MEELIGLLKDGRSRTLEMLAIELDTSVEKVERDIEFLENTGLIRRVRFSGTQDKTPLCNGCSGCGTGGKACAGCMPEGGFQHMGIMWEVVNGGSR